MGILIRMNNKALIALVISLLILQLNSQQMISPFNDDSDSTIYLDPLNTKEDCHLISQIANIKTIEDQYNVQDNGSIKDNFQSCIKVSLKLVADINEGSGHGHPTHMEMVGSKIYFRAFGDSENYGLWVYETTNSTHWQVATIESNLDADLLPDNLGGMIEIFHQRDLVIIGSRVYYSSYPVPNHSPNLWAFEFSNNTSWKINDNWMIGDIVSIGTRLFFSAYTESYGTELWAHEILNGSTWLVKDINLGVDSSSPKQFTVVDSKLFFFATNSSLGSPYYGDDLWAHDMDNSSTWLISEFNSGSSGEMVLIGSRLYLTVQGGTRTCQIWVHETSNNSIWKEVDLFDEFNMSWAFDPVVLGSRLYFSGLKPEHGWALWVHDSNNSSTWPIFEFNHITPNMNLYEYMILDSRLYFVSSSDIEVLLWLHDPADDSTSKLAVINWETENLFFTSLTGLENRLYFQADDGNSGRELWMLEILE